MTEFKPLTTQEEWGWAHARAKLIRCEDSQGIVALRNGKIGAVCVMDSFARSKGRLVSCHLHVAIDDPLCIRGGFVNEVFRHVFDVIGLDRVFGLVPSTNERALKFDTHVGFTEVVRIPDSLGEGVDYVVMRMDKGDCRWLARERKVA